MDLVGWQAGVNGYEDARVQFVYSPKGWTADALCVDYVGDHFYPVASISLILTTKVMHPLPLGSLSLLFRAPYIGFLSSA